MLSKSEGGEVLCKARGEAWWCGSQTGIISPTPPALDDKGDICMDICYRATEGGVKDNRVPGGGLGAWVGGVNT